MSVQSTWNVTGVFASVVTVVSGHSGRPSGAQSGLPSYSPAVLDRLIGNGLDPSAFSMKTSPAPAKPSAYAIRVPSGDQVQL